MAALNDNVDVDNPKLSNPADVRAIEEQARANRAEEPFPVADVAIVLVCAVAAGWFCWKVLPKVWATFIGMLRDVRNALR